MSRCLFLKNWMYTALSDASELFDADANYCRPEFDARPPVTTNVGDGQQQDRGNIGDPQEPYEPDEKLLRVPRGHPNARSTLRSLPWYVADRF
jgi:hypothetical protein